MGGATEWRAVSLRKGGRQPLVRWQPWASRLCGPCCSASAGIGYEIAKGIAQRAGTRTVLAARNEALGKAALEKLRAELAAAGRADALIFRQLDITDRQSVQAFADWAKQELTTVDVLVNNAGTRAEGGYGHPCAVPHRPRQHQLQPAQPKRQPAQPRPPLPPPSSPPPPAGFAYKGDVFGADECAHTLGVNFHGTAAVTEALLPLIPEGGRIINICSGGVGGWTGGWAGA